MAGRKSVLKLARWAAFAFCVALFAWALSKADLAAGWQRIVAIGPIVVIVLLPFVVSISCDAVAWRTLIASSCLEIGLLNP